MSTWIVTEQIPLLNVQEILLRFHHIQVMRLVSSLIPLPPLPVYLSRSTPMLTSLSTMAPLMTSVKLGSRTVLFPSSPTMISPWMSPWCPRRYQGSRTYNAPTDIETRPRLGQPDMTPRAVTTDLPALMPVTTVPRGTLDLPRHLNNTQNPCQVPHT